MVWEDKAANFDRVRSLLASEDVPEGSLIVLPEMFATGFSMNVAGIHEGEDRPTEHFLRELALAHRSTIVAGVVTRGPDGRGRNQATVVGPDGEEQTRYTKIHPFTYAGETDHYTPGDRLALFEWGGIRGVVLICYDLRFPEVYRHAARQGASLLITIANFPAARASHWTALNLARAIENQAYVVGVNRCGSDPLHDYSGQSMIIDPRGEPLDEAGSDETLIHADIDPAALAAYRKEFPALADVRDAFLPEIEPAGQETR